MSIQKLIDLQQRKLHQLNELKRFLLQNMFADKNRKQPVLRFDDFHNDWEQCKLGKVSKIVGGGTPSTKDPEYWDGTINWYTPAELDGHVYVNESERQITQKGYNNSSAKMLPKGTVLFTSRAGIGKTAILSKPATTNQGFQSIVPKANELNSYFIFSLTNQLKRYGETHGAGSTFVEVSGKELSKAQISLPTLQEQKMIAGLLKTLDHINDFQQNKLRQLKTMKKFLLQKMFI